MTVYKPNLSNIIIIIKNNIGFILFLREIMITPALHDKHPYRDRGILQ
jgi:hypothetical protein